MKNLFVFLVSLCLLSFAPKGEKNAKLEINGKQVGTYTSSTCFLGQCASYEVNDMEGNLIFTVEADMYKNPSIANKANPEGRVSYMVWTFYETKTKVETEVFLKKEFVQSVEKYKLFDSEGKLSKTGIENFSLRYGTKFSEDRKNLGSKTIIIR